MDLKEIIKWFIPCFHLLLVNFTRKMNVCLTICLFLFFSCPTLEAKVYRATDAGLSLSDSFLNSNDTKKVEIIENESFNEDQSEVHLRNVGHSPGSSEDSSVGRTFGRPFKKMLQAMIPLAFGMGSAATWAVVAALVGVKTLAVTLFIVKLLLIAGAAKIGSLFGSKGHESHGWSPQQKEIHLHIHNNAHQNHGEHESISPWSRDGVQNPAESKHVNVVYDPYANGPQTISTPYGHYMRIEPGQQSQ